MLPHIRFGGGLLVISSATIIPRPSGREACGGLLSVLFHRISIPFISLISAAFGSRHLSSLLLSDRYLDLWPSPCLSYPYGLSLVLSITGHTADANLTHRCLNDCVSSALQFFAFHRYHHIFMHSYAPLSQSCLLYCSC